LASQSPMCIACGDITAVGEELHETRGKQRVTFGLALDECGELAWEIVWGKARVEVAGQVFFAQRSEVDLLTQSVRLHLPLVVFKLMVAQCHILRPEGPNQKHALPTDPIAEMAQQINAGRVGPVKVFQQQYH